VAYSKVTLVYFADPNGSNLVGHALFGDDVGVVVIGVRPFTAG
jgi:bisdemethoxycurcumin synthase